VARLGADDVRQLDPFLAEGFFHHVGRLLLPVDLAAVGDRRAMPQVDAPAGAVVPIPEPLFPPGGLKVLLLKDLEEVGRFAEAGAGIAGEPAIGVMDGELPRRGPAHREAADGDAVFIDTMTTLY